MKSCKLTVVDEVNVCLTGVTADVLTKLKMYMRRFIPSAVHTPSFKMKRWDGFHYFFKNGWTFINLIDEGFISVLEKAGYEIEFIDRRVPSTIAIPKIKTDFFSHLLNKDGEPFILREYQAFAANIAFENANGIFVMATGAGKSYTMAAIASQFRLHGKVMVIVPSIDLTVQTAKAFRELGIEKVGEFYGEEKIVEDVTISTWQSLRNYPEILNGVVCLMADECQEYKAKEVNELLTVAAKNVQHRYGFTGSLPKADIDKMLLEASLGPVLFTKAAWELQEEGILANCDINMLSYEEPNADDLDEQFKNDHDVEANYLMRMPKRLEHMASYFEEVAQTGNTLILVKNLHLGKELEKLIPGSLFMSGATKSKKRRAEYDAIQTATNAILICTFGIASRGIDCPRLFHVGLVDPGKDAIKIIQSIGRGLRRAKDKDHVDIHDVYGNLKFSKRHAAERRKLYKENKYPFTTHKVYYR